MGKANADVSQLQDLLKVVIQLLKNVQEQLDTVVELKQCNKFSLKHFEGSDDDIKFWTGFYSYNSLIYFYNGFILPNEANMKYWGTKNTNVDRQFKTGMAHQLSPIDEMFLTLIKLRRGSANEDLAERFNLSSKYVSSIVITWVNLMAATFRKTNIWLSKKKVRKLMPNSFKPIYSDVRVIIDCTELEIERPSDFEIQSATYSTYKSRNTVKGLIGLSPTGVTTFVSDLMEGSVSDNDITLQSGLVSKLEKGDAIMADRGWTNKTALSSHGIRLVVPHFLKGRTQLPISDLVESVSLARLRIHVERCIGRIKQWKILTNKVPLTYWNNLNDIWFVCANLLLFWPPLID
jgi:hypothetical protein